jgi:DNA helicase-2/ATP-dependent DNA helicase PcrA
MSPHSESCSESSPEEVSPPREPALASPDVSAHAEASLHERLNPRQRLAATHGADPLLIIAGAGTGKTMTLAHRVAHLLARGADPRRILLLTFTRRAAAEMTRRARRIAAEAGAADAGRISWSGTFHSVANRLLRIHAEGVGLDREFTVLDRSDSADLMNLLRNELGFSGKGSRFPRKATCLSIYSHVINTRGTIERTLEHIYPWCAAWTEELKRLFRAYVEAKQKQNVLDYDDLLLYWHHLMQEEDLADAVRKRFDHVLVDEYQDTNSLQADILLGLRPEGRGLTVVGDDAQSIYSFRAATVRNILDFPGRFDPPATVVTLEENFRSTGPILEACNAVISLARERFTKDLHSRRASREKPVLAAVEDEIAQVEYVVTRVLEHHEAGIDLRRQAVLMRASHHSDALEVELARRNIPFVKYGGLKFLEAAHVKDLVCVLRWAENPRDSVAAFRVLQLLPGIGPATAARAIEWLAVRGFDFRTMGEFRVPAAAAEDWPLLCETMRRLRDRATPWAGQAALAHDWYRPHLERLHENARVRAGDLDQLEQIAGQYPSRERFLTELTLDPPEATGDESGPPRLDEDWLVLSTIHSAKGMEWDVVFVLDVVDGCIPSDMAAGSDEEIEEERRLLYVAMTRARDHLHLLQPLRFYTRQQGRGGDRHLYAPRSRFLPDSILDRFERRAHAVAVDEDPQARDGSGRKIDVASRLREMWD